MKKIILSIIASLLITVSNFAADGTTGNLTWSLNGSTLTISGSGAMPDYTSGNSPWYSNRTNIKTVNIGNQVTRIGNFAFSNCNKISSVIISEGLTSIGEFAFNECSSLSSIALPASLKRVEDRAFRRCTGLTSIHIPTAVNFIGVNLFSGCTKLSGIEVETGNTVYSSADGVLFDKTKKSLISFPGGKTGTSYTIPNTVKTLEIDAFGGCERLTSLVIPESVTAIKNEVFVNCTGLKSMIVKWTNPNSVTYGTDIFYGVAVSNVQLSVPSSAKTAYQSHSIWKNFIIVDTPEANWLIGLVLSSGKLSPSFSPDITSYKVSVPVSVSTITFAVTPYSADATISGDGTKVLNVGENVFDIVVSAKINGFTKKRTYTVTVYRSDKDVCLEFDHSTYKYASGTISIPYQGQNIQIPVTVISGCINYYRLTTGNYSGSTTFHFEWEYQTSNKTVNVLPNSNYMVSLDMNFTANAIFTTYYDAYGRPSTTTVEYNYFSCELSIADDNSVLLTEITRLPIRVSSSLSTNIVYEGSSSALQVIDKQPIAIHPNPATNFISINGLQGNETLHFYNISGNLLFSHKATSEMESISVSHLPAGVYFVRIGDEKTIKFIKK
jgi:hypothetical protein